MDPQTKQRPPISPTLADPGTLGEDLREASRRAFELAPIHCDECLSYHLLFPIKRYLSPVAAIPDQSQMVAAIGELLTKTAAIHDGRIDIVVAGAADTGVLAICAHAADRFLQAARHRVRFTALDLCKTPLALCADYATRNDIELDIHAVDIVSTAIRCPADVIVLHSLLCYIRPESHEAVLRKLASWLKPEGRIVFSTEIRSANDEDTGRERRHQRIAEIKASVEAGAFTVNEPIEVFYARLENAQKKEKSRLFDFENANQLHELFRRAGLLILSSDQIVKSMDLASGNTSRRERIVAVLAAPSAK
jgi:SAM-dependent methyltransferase